jgi:hypothetical protein
MAVSGTHNETGTAEEGRAVEDRCGDNGTAQETIAVEHFRKMNINLVRQMGFRFSMRRRGSNGPQGLKPFFILLAFAARLKSSPVTKPAHARELAMMPELGRYSSYGILADLFAAVKGGFYFHPSDKKPVAGDP